MKKIIILIIIIVLLNNVLAYESNEALDYHAMQIQYVDVDLNLHIPISLENYNPNESFFYKTRAFINTSAQKADFEAFYYDDSGNKIFAEIEEDDIGNKYVVFEVNPITKNEYVFKIQGNLRVENNLILNNETYDLSEPITNEIAGEEVEQFMEHTRFLRSQETEIINLVENLKESQEALSELVLLTNWVNQNIEYDLAYSEVMLDALETLKNRKGVCNEISILLGAMLRARGFPVKYVVGIANTSVHWGPHAWLEVFVPGQGWIYVDPTYNEVGLVDASHLVISKLRDSSDSEDRISTRSSTLSVNFGEKELQTKINEQRSFSEFGYDKYIDVQINTPSRIRSGSLLDVDVVFRNTTANKITAFGILMAHEDFISIDKKKGEVLLLEPFQEKRKTYYYLLPDNHLALSYSLKYIGQFDEHTQHIIVGPDERIFKTAFFVNEPMIYFIEDQMLVEIEVFNYTEEEKNLLFEFEILEEVIEEQETIPVNSEHKINYELPIIEEGEIEINISGDYQYHRTINILPGQEIIIEEEETINEEIIDINILTEETDDIFQNIDQREQKESTKINVLFVIVFLGLFVFSIIALVLKTKIQK